MFFDYLIAIVTVPLLLLSWLLVQAYARKFAKSHPEFGPAREEGAGCGKSCLCSGKEGCQQRKSRSD